MNAPVMLKRGNALPLIRAIKLALGDSFDLLAAQERAWSSATFCGARHVLDGRIVCSDAAANALAALPEQEFDLPGEIVADCVVHCKGDLADENGTLWRHVGIEILTINAD